ncbi:MAG: hypothetical protein IKD85_06280 [Firmicutes bacterium]|nr:hypothetical protein [Bacillota bacterium]
MQAQMQMDAQPPFFGTESDRRVAVFILIDQICPARQAGKTDSKMIQALPAGQSLDLKNEVSSRAGHLTAEGMKLSSTVAGITEFQAILTRPAGQTAV